MKSIITSAVTAVLLAGSALAQDAPQVNTPASSTVCQPLLINWSGGTPPYFLSILPGNQPSAQPLIDFGEVSGSQLTWVVNVTNAELGINLRDSSGRLSQSAAFPNLAGTNQACLTSTPTPPTPAPTGSSNSSSASTPAPPTTTPAPVPTSTSPISTPPASSPASSKPSTPATSSPAPAPSGAASGLSAQAGLAAAVGFAVAAFFA